jgi:hypothetical protein
VRRRLARALPAFTRHSTFPSAWPLLQLDRIYVWPRLALVASRTDLEASAISDHLPVIADVRIPSFVAATTTVQPLSAGEKVMLSETISRPNGPSTMSPGRMNP